MTSAVLLLSLELISQPRAPAPAAPETAADVITLRDGSIILGQVAEPATRGPLVIYLRRAWAEANLPPRAKRWEAAEGPELRKAYQMRRERLAAWRSERVKDAGEPGADRIGQWLDQQLERADPAGERDPPRAPLMVVTLDRAEIKSIVRRPRGSARMLRQGWLSGFPEVETMKLADLKDALAGRGFAGGTDEAVPLDPLLPIRPETEQQWLTRRAATEVVNDTGVRFIQIANVLVPEPNPGQPLTMDTALAMASNLVPLLGDKPVDPLEAQLRAVADRGRVGVMLTQQQTSPTLDAVAINISLWVRNGQRWSKAGARSASVRTSALRPGDADDLGRDPQLAGVFQIFESVGFGFPPEVKQQSLKIGAATRKALGTARTAFTERLAAMALPLEPGAADKAKGP
jgi:hypothetical protein